VLPTRRENALFTATLRCGTVLSYESPTFRPALDELVPCRNHGYCVVKAVGRPSPVAPTSRRAGPRPESDLRAWLAGRSETTIHALRRHGFTLRAVAAAERRGLVVVDLPAGRVAVNR
jgi:hypothetical protein